jgi:hypothetical protein
VDSKTGLALFATDDAFEDALDKYLSAKITADVHKSVAKAAREASDAEQNKISTQRWLNSIKIATERYPDWAEVVDIGDEGDKKNVFRNKDLKTIKLNSVLDAWLLDSDYGALMLYHLAKNPSEIERIQSLSPFKSARELTKLEDKLSTGSTPIPEKKETKEESSSSSTEMKRVSSAPAPASSVSGKSTAPIDEIENAVKKEQFRGPNGYFAAANREEHAKRKKS